MNDIFTQKIKDLMKLATTDFDEFYKQTEKQNKDKGDHSTAASSGNYSKAASSGDSSTAASSGDYSTAASSGDYSKAASSGDYSKAASSGDYSKAASSGNSSTAASSGDHSTAASSGNHSKAASSGYSSTAASSGNSSTAASSGDHSTAASSGNYSTAASSGNCSKAASSGDHSTAASSGNYSKAASSGNRSKAASSGNYSTAASSGYYSACSALGYGACVKGDIGNLLMCSEYNKEGKLLGGRADLVDGVKIKPDTLYSVLDGQWVEVDLTDGIFGYVVSVRGNVKKLKNSSGGFGYVVSDGQGNAAHGKTIKEARDDLAFKLMSKDVDQFKNMPLKTTKTPQEWAMVYRAITGACQYGIKQFMDRKGELKETYTLKEILKQTEGAYGFYRFKQVVRGK